MDREGRASSADDKLSSSHCGGGWERADSSNRRWEHADNCRNPELKLVRRDAVIEADAREI